MQRSVVDNKISRTMSVGMGFAVLIAAVGESVVEGVCVRECS